MHPQQMIAPLADVPVVIEAELDRRQMAVIELLRLEEGDVVRLCRSAGENIDIRAGGSVVAYGEIVVLEDTLAVRITDFKDVD